MRNNKAIKPIIQDNSDSFSSQKTKDLTFLLQSAPKQSEEYKGIIKNEEDSALKQSDEYRLSQPNVSKSVSQQSEGNNQQQQVNKFKQAHLNFKPSQ